MGRFEWPGIATAVGILLVVTLVIVGSRDDFHLKDWQPLIAALIALAGGSLAYRAAMAKVYADEEREERSLSRERLGLYYRLNLALNNLVSECISARELTRSLQVREFGASQLRFDMPDEVEEGWAKIELLPTSAIQQLDVIRYAHRELYKLLDGLATDYKFKPFTDHADARLKKYLDFLTTLQGSCTKVQIDLNAAITALTQR